MNEEKHESWLISEGKLENGLPFVLRFREDLPDESLRGKLSTLIVISWFFETEDGNGLPKNEDQQLMEEFENVLDDELVEKGTARLMTVFTGEGLREWQLYTDDEEFFVEKFNRALADVPALPLEIEAFEDGNWDAYNDYTRLAR